MAVIGAVCDDFTGTASAGVLVAKAGAKTGLFFDAKALKEFGSAYDLDAIYVSSNSRHFPPQRAYDAVLEAVKELQGSNVKYFSKKIDTTLRGGIGHEIDAMLDCLGEDVVAVMVTALPASKRICVGGHAVIDGVVLTETFAVNDVKTPVRECYIPELVGNQSKRKTDLIMLKDVLQGREFLMQKMRESRENGSRIIIIDAISTEHIDIIAQSCVELGWNILAVDPGPFTMQLAYRRGLVGEVKKEKENEIPVRNEKTALLIVGSANPLTRLQLDKLREKNEKIAVVSVSPHKLVEGGMDAALEVTEAVKNIVELFAEKENKPEAIIVETAMHGSVMNLEEEDSKHGYHHGMSSMLINDGLARITDMVLQNVGQKNVAGLLLTGGDTMECVCRKIGVEYIQALDNVVAQVDVGKIIGRYDGLPVIVKGGFCGYEEIEIDIVNRLFLESSRGGEEELL